MATTDLTISRELVAARSLRGRRVDWTGTAFQMVLLVSLLLVMAFIVVLLYTVLDNGLVVYQERGFVISEYPSSLENALTDTGRLLANPTGLWGWVATLLAFVVVPALVVWAVVRRKWKLLITIVAAIVLGFLLAALVGTSDFMTSNLSRIPERAGIAQAIFGTVVLALITAVVSLPLGVATAVYLEEYAPANRLTNFVRLNIRNLAGVPSVVYGLLGLAIFVNLLGNDIGSIPVVGGLLEDIFGDGGLTGGRTVIAGGLALAVLVLPIVIITASESIRAVPQSLREGGYGVGATRWEVTRNLVLPNAFAGILTGTILSLSRAIGETAPLILVGAFYGTFFTTGNADFFDKFRTTYTALPQVVYQWATEPSDEFRVSLASAAIIALLAITLLMNLVAVLLRNHYEKRW